jgi:acetyltransferase-like isoleucine patch superfamily enzyme
MEFIKRFIKINEEITLWDVFYKYTFRDTILGCISLIPATFGIILRMLILPLFMKACGKGFTVKPFVTIKFPENLKVGKHVGIGEYCWIDANGGIEIGDYTRIGPNVVIASLYHEYKDPEVPVKMQQKIVRKIIIGRDVSIASSVTIQSGLKIGDGAVIGAGAVVTKDICANGVVVAMPSRMVGRRGEMFKK